MRSLPGQAAERAQELQRYQLELRASADDGSHGMEGTRDRWDGSSRGGARDAQSSRTSRDGYGVGEGTASGAPILEGEEAMEALVQETSKLYEQMAS